MTLSHEQVRAFYDRLGIKQDWQRFYEAPAMNELVRHMFFEEARAVFEFGSGTGRLAEALLQHHLAPSAIYYGVDISATMVSLARTRLARFGHRAGVALAAGKPLLDAKAGTFDRFISLYVLDLLSPGDTQRLLVDAHRVLLDGGVLGLVSLTHGFTVPSRLVERVWTTLYSWSPAMVGGCRPISLLELVHEPDWRVRYRARISRFGVPSEIVVAQKVLRLEAAA